MSIKDKLAKAKSDVVAILPKKSDDKKTDDVVKGRKTMLESIFGTEPKNDVQSDVAASNSTSNNTAVSNTSFEDVDDLSADLEVGAAKPANNTSEIISPDNKNSTENAEDELKPDKENSASTFTLTSTLFVVLCFLHSFV